MTSNFNRNDVIHYINLVEKVQKHNENYEIANFNEDAKEIREKHDGITSLVESKVLLSAKMQNEPLHSENYKRIVRLPIERSTKIDNYEQLNEISRKVLKSLN